MTRQRKKPKLVEDSLVLSLVDNDDNDDNEFLREWATHTDSSFHHFEKEEASKIRSTLLSWYRENRRKLPWRGDPPPYDGSTAGMNTNTNANHQPLNNKKKKKAKNDGQTNISSFFKTTTTTRNNQRKVKQEEESNTKITLVKKDEEMDDEHFQLPISAYGIWVSEIMLQQTRVEAVIPYYLKWMKKFPTVYELANASEDDVNSHWAGLGFYRRARMLHQGAKYVVDELNGELPQTVDELMKIQGIGRYTASAIASIAFNQPVPVVDGNVCRVLSRLKGVANNIKAPIFKDKFGWELAQQLIDGYDDIHNHNAGEINQALMELGATYCAPSGTGIDENDPLKPFYMSTKIGKSVLRLQNSTYFDEILSSLTSDSSSDEKSTSCPLCKPKDIATALYQIQDDISTQLQKESQSSTKKYKDQMAAICGHQALPMAPPKKAKREEVLVVATIQYNDKWLMVKRPKDGLLAGQWEFPATCIWNSNEQKKGQKNKTELTVDVPFIKAKIRSESLTQDLRENFLSFNDIMEEREFLELKRNLVNKKDALEHIFSHVRHSIWIEHLDMVNCDNFNHDESYWKKMTTNGREVRWMSEHDMKEVGITSGVRKILSAVKKSLSTSKKRKKIKLEN